MASIIYHELNRNYEGSGTPEDGFEHVEHYEILFDSPPSSEIQCYTHTKSPKFGDRHVDDLTTQVSNVEATSVDGVKFDLAVTYSRFSEDDDDDDPLARPAKIVARSVQGKVFTVLDADGKPVLNTAGDVAAPREVQRSFLVLSVTKNLPPFPWPLWILEYRDAVNANAIRIKGRTFARRTLRADNIFVPDKETENDVDFVPVSFDLTHNRRGWRDRVLNQGFNEKIDKPTKDKKGTKKTVESPVRIQKTKGGDFIREPVFLDTAGKAFRHQDDEKETIRNPTPEEIITIEVKDYDELPFTVLPLK